MVRKQRTDYTRMPPDVTVAGQRNVRAHLFFSILLLVSINLLLIGCSPAAQVKNSPVKVTVRADGTSQAVEVPAGSTVEAALTAAGVVPGNLDRTVPGLDTIINSPINLQVSRVVEEFEVHKETIPFEHQIVRNESFPAGETRLIQPGVDGIKETTYRRLLEDGKEVSSTPVKQDVVVDPSPEIVMVGVQIPFAPINIPGHIAFLSAGSGWIMETTTGIRRPLVTTGDMDGRIFSLSPDGEWLLFSRKGSKTDPKAINSLWIVNTSSVPNQPVSINVSNVIHFAAWDPQNPMTVDYSTVEPRTTAPGWQANNDLQTISFTGGGVIASRKTIIQPNSGGIYGWWGTYFYGLRMEKPLPIRVLTRSGLSISMLANFSPDFNITPYQAPSDWAWVPGIGWSPDLATIFTIDHSTASDSSSKEESGGFNLAAVLPVQEKSFPIKHHFLTFASPQPSPSLEGEPYQLAYLQAVFPDRSETSTYRLAIMDQDGSNRRMVFPEEGSPGIEPQNINWSPEPLASKNYAIAIISGRQFMVD